MALANVALTDTFDVWRIRTNQLVTEVNVLDIVVPAAFNQANAAPGIANTYATAVGISGNSYATSVGTSDNTYARSVGTSGNTYATSVGTSGNTYASSVGVGANTYATSVGTSGNTYASSVGVGANTYSLAAFTQANNALITAQGAYGQANAAPGIANSYATLVGTSGNVYAVSVGVGANTYATAVGAAGNVYTVSVGASGNSYAAFWANTKLSNTSGVSFAGDLMISGNVGIGTAQTSIFRLEVNGAFAATTKSFVIDHPTKAGHKLRYGSLEGPENGVYIRGKSTSNIIELPDYWTWLVDEDTITVNITPIGKKQTLFVDKIKNNKVYIKNDAWFRSDVNYFYTVYGERKDVEKLIAEIPNP